MEIVGTEGRVYSNLPWLRTLDFELKDKRAEEALRRELTDRLRVLDEPPYAPWATDDQSCRMRAQLADFVAAIKEDREPAVTAESGGEPIKLMNGLHWHGWRHAEAFRRWAISRGLPAPATAGEPPTVDDAAAADWRGGDLVRDLLGIVKSPEPWLTAPFLP